MPELTLILQYTGIVYDPSLWTEFGYIVQNYIGSAFSVAIRIFAIVAGISIFVKIFNAFL